MNRLSAGALALAIVVLPPIAMADAGRHGGGHASGTRSSSGIEHVHGYTTKRGTHVAAYDRTKANGTKRDNWSTKGNVNPETGKPGTKDP